MKYKSWNMTWFMLVWSLVVMAICLAGVVASRGQPVLLLFLPALLFAGLASVRSFYMNVEVEEGSLIVRNLARKHVIPLNQVREFRIIANSKGGASLSVRACFYDGRGVNLDAIRSLHKRGNARTYAHHVAEELNGLARHTSG